MTHSTTKEQTKPSFFSQVVILSKEYLAIVQRFLTEFRFTLSRKTLNCAAKLLHLFVNYTRWALKNKSADKQFFYVAISSESSVSLVDLLNGEHGRDAIIKALNFLIEAGLLKRQLHFNGQVKTYSYSADLSKLTIGVKGVEEKSTGGIDFSTTRVDFSTDLDQCIPSINQTPDRSEPEPVENFVLEETAETAAIAQPIASPITPKPKPLLRSDRVVGDLVPAAPAETIFPPELAALGVEKNPTVLKAVQAFPQRLKGAIAYLENCLQQGWVRNPSGLLVKLLKEGKDEVRQAIALDAVTLQRAVQTEVNIGSPSQRSSALHRLKSYAALGYEREISALCDRHPDWGFRLQNGAIEDLKGDRVGGECYEN